MKIWRSEHFRDALKAACAAPETRPAKTFWQDFRARASLTVQGVTTVAEDNAAHSLAWRPWASVAAAVIVLCTFFVLRQPVETTIASNPPPVAPAGLSKVDEVEVFSDYSSVLIVEDIENGGTVIWVAAADTPSVP